MDAIRAKTRASRSYIPLLAETLFSDAQAIAQSMRKQGSIVEVATEVSSLKKGLDYANRQGFSSVVIFGTDEKKSGSLKVKDMETGEERLERIP
jgi:histidyl-tRNA synthetase